VKLFSGGMGSGPDITNPTINDYAQAGFLSGNSFAALQQLQRIKKAPDQFDLPPVAPDATDEALRKRRALAMTQAGLGMGRKSTFLTGESQLGQPLLGKTLLGGY
jgi:hypothetical protein